MESNPRIEVWNEEKETLLTQYRKKPFITDIINLKNRRNDLSPGYWILIMLNLGYPTEELKGGERRGRSGGISFLINIKQGKGTI